jgi:hypothetical protein
MTPCGVRSFDSATVRCATPVSTASDGRNPNCPNALPPAKPRVGSAHEATPQPPPAPHSTAKKLHGRLDRNNALRPSTLPRMEPASLAPRRLKAPFIGHAACGEKLLFQSKSNHLQCMRKSNIDHPGSSLLAAAAPSRPALNTPEPKPTAHHTKPPSLLPSRKQRSHWFFWCFF